MAKVIITDGSRHETIYRQIKTLNAMTDETPGVWSPDVVDAKNAAKSNRLVPSVFAGVNTRMQAMADLPFTIYSVKGDKELENSDNYKNIVGFLPYPSMTFAMTEGALVTAGRAYWYKGTGTRTGQVKELKYWMPSSVTLDPETAKKGEINFRRVGVNGLFPAKDVLYTWGLDSDVELGPPTVWPLESALIAAEANGSITKWVADYMRRGAVKAMLLMVDGMPPAGEVDRIEGWFNRFMGGVRGLTWRVFNGAAIKPTIVGDGLEALRDMTVSKELRYEIHTALGTRHLLEDENYATADARERQFVTQTIVPDARLIQYNFNEQVLHPLGYHMEFEPQRLEIFQKDEAEQSRTFGELFNVFREVLPVDIAFQLTSEKLDYQFTDEQQAMIARGLAEKKAKAEEVAKQAEVKPEPKQEDDPVPPEVVKALTELDKFEKKVNAAGKMVTWHAVSLSADMVKAISSGELSFEDARAQIEVFSNFGKLAALAPSMNKGSEEIKALAASIDKAIEAATKGGDGSGNFGHAGRPGEVGGSAPVWAGSGHLEMNGYTLHTGRFGLVKDKWAVENEDGSNGNFRDTPEEAIADAERLRGNAEQRHEAEQKRKELIKELADSGREITINDIRVISNGYPNFSTTSAIGVLREAGYTRAEAERIILYSGAVGSHGVSSGGANLWDGADVVQIMIDKIRSK